MATFIPNEVPYAKSFVVRENTDGSFKIESSPLVVGYTKAHCDTPAKALMAAAEYRDGKIARLREEVAQLVDMMHSSDLHSAATLF
jgi:hypothetical protein